MLFTQTEFLCLFVAVLAWTLTARTVRARNLGLLAASYYFYAWWDWRFLGLILLSTAVDFLVGRAMASAVGTARRRLLLVSLVTNLGLLGFFKYAGFFVASFRAAFGPLLEPLGFHLGPRINAAGRVAHASAGVDLLTTHNASSAKSTAKEIDAHNIERRGLQQEVFEAACRLADTHPDPETDTDADTDAETGTET